MAKKKRSESEQADSTKYGREYYQKNKERLQEDRRRRYREDPDYQRRMKVAAQRAYWLRKRPGTTGEGASTVPDVRLGELVPKGTIQVTIDNLDDVRHGTVVEVPVFTTAAVQALVGRNSQTVRVWLKDGILPEPYFRGRMLPGVHIAKGRNPRLFTLDELRAIDECRPNLTLATHGKKHDIFTRCITQAFEALVQGLVPQTA